jgi:hypothetical protein
MSLIGDGAFIFNPFPVPISIRCAFNPFYHRPSWSQQNSPQQAEKGDF